MSKKYNIDEETISNMTKEIVSFLRGDYKHIEEKKHNEKLKE